MIHNSGNATTIRRLLLMRHAKSDWSVDGQPDHDRTLNERGMRDAPKMANWLENAGLVPDFVLSSSAERTRQTFSLMSEAWGTSPQVAFIESLYLAPAETILAAIAEASADCQTLMVLGHNPGLSHLCSELAGKFGELPTAAIAHFEAADAQWNEIAMANRFEHVQTIRPKAI